MLRDFMIGVTEDEGTGYRASIKGFKVAGKTGTAQKIDPLTGGYSSESTVVSFMGFVPADDPKLSILVVVDEPLESSFGGVIAAPVFKRIAQKTLKYLKIIPSQEVKFAEIYEDDLKKKDLDFQLVSSDGKSEGALFDSADEIMPDFGGLSIREVLRIAQKRSIDISIKGSGVSFMQKPKAGSKINAKGKCTVFFRPI